MSITRDRIDPSNHLVDPSLDPLLFVCTEILELESLHYGYWDRPEIVDPAAVGLDAFRRAQARYTETLIDLIPDGVSRVLDVGCGVGDVDRALVERGFRVTALSPDRAHARFFNGRYNGQLRFHNVPFEAFDVDADRHDLVLLSESQSYIDPEVTFRRARRSLEDGGWMLVSGMFRSADTPEYAGNYVEDDYIAGAGEHGLRLVRRIDISRNTYPTIACANHLYATYAPPVQRLVEQLLGDAGMLKVRALRWVFNGQAKQLEDLLQHVEERFDAELFDRRIRYVRLLFRTE